MGVFIDAEETWIQDPVDVMTILMMEQFNKNKAVVYNTLQLYRHDRLQFLKDSYEAALQRNFMLGAKLVRGAYMERERRRAGQMNYPSPIQPDKAATDTDFNDAIQFCIDHLDRIALVVASHNEYSNLLHYTIAPAKRLPLHHPHVHLSQLFGMSDNITFNLAIAGCQCQQISSFRSHQGCYPLSHASCTGKYVSERANRQGIGIDQKRNEEKTFIVPSLAFYSTRRQLPCC